MDDYSQLDYLNSIRSATLKFGADGCVFFQKFLLPILGCHSNAICSLEKFG